MLNRAVVDLNVQVKLFFTALIAAINLSACTNGASSNSTGTTTLPPPTAYTLNIASSGGGTVTSLPAGINCGSSCTASFNIGTSVTLSARASSGFSFLGWSGDCGGTSTCTTTMSAARSATAAFIQNVAGNPSNITLSLVPSRFSGVAPLSVFFDASGTTAIARATPFHDLEYHWNFGDTSAGIWAYGAKPGTSSKNLDTGPEAAHVFETPGTYTVTLAAFDGTNIASTTTTITVSDPDTVFSGTNTICFSTGTDFTGCPAGAATHTAFDFSTAINTYIATGKRLLFKSGDTYAESSNAIISVTGPGIIGMFGAGAKPKINPTATYPIQLGSGSVLTMQDWRIMDLEFNGGSSNTTIGVWSGGDADQITLLRLNMHDMGSGISLDADVIVQTAGTHIFDQITVQDCDFERFIGSIGWYLYADHLALLGNFVNDTTGGTAQHVVRIMHSAPGIISHNTFGNPSPTHQAFTLRGVSYSATNCNAPTGTGQCLPAYFPYGSYAALTSQTVVSDNHFISGNTQQPVTVEPSDINYFDTRFQDILLERNWYTATTGGNCCLPMLKITAQDVTVRNEVMDMTTGGTGVYKRGIAIQGAGTVAIASNNVRIYNNTVFGNDSFDFQSVQVQSGATNVSVVNNIFYSPNINSTVNTTNAVVASNNSMTTNISPNLAAVPPASPADFKIATGSYAIGHGTAVPVWSDFFLAPITATSIHDMGAVIH